MKIPVNNSKGSDTNMELVDGKLLLTVDDISVNLDDLVDILATYYGFSLCGVFGVGLPTTKDYDGVRWMVKNQLRRSIMMNSEFFPAWNQDLECECGKPATMVDYSAVCDEHKEVNNV